MTKKWGATLAPVGPTNIGVFTIAPDCKIILVGRPPLLFPFGEVAGEVTSASIRDGYLTVEGTLIEGVAFPFGSPTFAAAPGPWNPTVGPDGRLVFRTCEILSVRDGLVPLWNDPKIRFHEPV
jgi:hypothetical protein